MKTRTNTRVSVSRMFRLSALALSLVFSAQMLNATDDYYPTDDTGPHNPLEPVPDHSSTLVLGLLGAVVLIGTRRLSDSRFAK